jgi:hypothetical protein
MKLKSTWTAVALVGLVAFTPMTADGQIRQSTTVENRTSTARQRAVIRQREAARQRAEAQRAEVRRGSIYDRDDDSDGNRKRSCAKLSKNDKERCKQLRKEEHRLAKLEKRQEHCLTKHQSNPSHPHCDGVNGRASVRDRLPDVIYGGGDVRRPRGTDPASGVLGRLPRSGL